MAMTDDLTGLFNRRHFTRQGMKELGLAQRSQQPCALIMLDIDHFKAINDTHGHQAGDDVLKTLARVIGQNVREADTVGRLGGEELAVLLPNTDGEVAASLAERLRQSVEAIPHVVNGQALTVTVSLGVASLWANTDTLDTLLSRADQAMYAAKHQGRNRVMIYTPTGIIPYLTSQASA
jgi:diguanylate cyclase (GGDEF)-like protein